MDSMIAPPSVNLRKGKKGGKEKPEAARQPVALVQSEEIATFETLRSKILNLFMIVDNLNQKLSESVQVQPATVLAKQP